MEVELEPGKSIKMEEDGGDFREEKGSQTLVALEKAVKNLKVDAYPAERSELIMKLRTARMEATAEERLAKKLVWREKTRKEVLERAQFQERMVKLLPVEWEELLKQVKDCKDKRVMTGMSLMWREVTKKDRTQVLFHEIFPLLCGGYLSLKDMLGCRRACQEWKNSVDSYFQNLLRFGTDSERFEEIKTIIGFEEYLSQFGDWADRNYTSGENPFPTRKFQIGKVKPDPELPWRLNRSFWSRMERFLENWGREIWQVFIYFDLDCDANSFYNTLHRFLELMPNLRLLGILYLDRNWIADEEMANFLCRKPLPELRHLRTINAGCPPTLMNALLQKCASTMESLYLVDMSDNSGEFTGATNLPNLETFSRNSNVFAVERPGTWPSLKNVIWDFGNFDASSVLEIFGRLNALRGSLRFVTLMLEKVSRPSVKLSQEQLNSLSLDLPLVEMFVLSVSKLNLKGIDFILPMISLQQLHLIYFRTISSSKPKADNENQANDNSEDGEEVIKFSRYMNRMYESNIWALFPQLQRLHINVINEVKIGRGIHPSQMNSVMAAMVNDGREYKHKKYTREGYLQHLANGR